MRGIFGDLRFTLRQYEKKKAVPLMKYMAYLLIITTVVTGVSLSRYLTGIRALDDTARVAGFDIEVTTTWSDGDVSAHAPGGLKEYTFTVKNNSEVAVEAMLVVDSYTGAAPAVSWGGWVPLMPGGTDTVAVSIYGAYTGNNIEMHIEYKQID